MLRNKLSLLIAAAGLTFGLTACDDGGDDGDTGAQGTETADTNETADTEEDTAETADTEEDTAESEDTAETADTEEDTAESEDTNETADDTTGEADPCADVTCEDGVEECIAGICVPIDDSSESESDSEGGDGDPSYPNPAGGCPAGTIDGNSALNPGINVCLPACDDSAADILSACPQPASGTAPGLCVLGDGSGSGAACEMNGAQCDAANEYCLGDPATMENGCTVAVACIVNCQQGTCPDGMTCNAQSVCVY